MDDLKNTDFEYLGSALGNALASGVTLEQLILAWYNTESVEEWDIAVAAQGRLQQLQSSRKKNVR